MSPEVLLAGIRDADCHRGGIRCLRLFDLERTLAHGLRAEVDTLIARETGSDVQEREHVTNWTRPTGAVRQFSLLNRSGDFADYHEDHDLSCLGKRFHHANAYPLLAAFASRLVHAVNLRVNVLGAGAGLAAHEEHSLFISAAGTAAVRARFHLPLRTSRGARLLLDGDACRFAPHSVYYFNQGCIHAAQNPAPTPRIHLVWDQLLTPQVHALMFGDGATPAGWRRRSAERQAVRVLGRVSMTGGVRTPPRVTPNEAETVSLCVEPDDA